MWRSVSGMRIEVHSPEGLEAGYQGLLGTITKDAANHYTLTTSDGYGVVLLYMTEVAKLVDAFQRDAA